MRIATLARPFQISTRWLIAGLLAAALFAAALVQAHPVGAAVWCGGQYTTYCPVYSGYQGYAGYAGYANYAGYAPYTAVFRQYTDNRSNCPDGQVTQTVGGYFCTNYGVPAFVPGSVPTFAGYGFAGYPAGYAGYAGYNPVYAGYRVYCAC